jgi:hypothetical protein
MAANFRGPNQAIETSHRKIKLLTMPTKENALSAREQELLNKLERWARLHFESANDFGVRLTKKGKYGVYVGTDLSGGWGYESSEYIFTEEEVLKKIEELPALETARIK